MCSQRISQFYLHTHTFIRNRNEPYLPLPSQPQLVLIYRPRRDGRLSRPWCEVAQAEIRTRNLTIANAALYHTQPVAHQRTRKEELSGIVSVRYFAGRLVLLVTQPPASEHCRGNVECLLRLFINAVCCSLRLMLTLQALADNAELMFVRPAWIHACHSAQKLVPCVKFAVVPP